MQTVIVVVIAAVAIGYLVIVVRRSLRSGGGGCCSSGCLDTARQQDQARLADPPGSSLQSPCQCPSGDKSPASCGPCGQSSSSGFANLPIPQRAQDDVSET